MAAYNLILLDCGDVMYSELHRDSDRARMALCDWIMENWHDEDADPNDFSQQDMIEYFFDHHEDYRWYMQPIKLPKEPGEEIILTPGMCAIIRHGLSNVQYGHAAKLLEQHEEIEHGEDAGLAAQNVVGEILDQFE